MTKYIGAGSLQIDGSHYKEMSIQPWDAMEVLLSPAEFIGFLKGNYLKYLMRDGKKHGAMHDTEKARHYAAKLAEMEAHR